jgi:hypothetical protein
VFRSQLIVYGLAMEATRLFKLGGGGVGWAVGPGVGPAVGPDVGCGVGGVGPCVGAGVGGTVGFAVVSGISATAMLKIARCWSLV